MKYVFVEWLLHKPCTWLINGLELHLHPNISTCTWLMLWTLMPKAMGSKLVWQNKNKKDDDEEPETGKKVVAPRCPHCVSNQGMEPITVVKNTRTQFRLQTYSQRPTKLVCHFCHFLMLVLHSFLFNFSAHLYYLLVVYISHISRVVYQSVLLLFLKIQLILLEAGFVFFPRLPTRIMMSSSRGGGRRRRRRVHVPRMARLQLAGNRLAVLFCQRAVVNVAAVDFVAPVLLVSQHAQIGGTATHYY